MPPATPHKNPQEPTTPGLITTKRVFWIWLPLASTWFMMAAEGPFISAIMARLDNPAFNLAAFGIAVSFIIFIESPIFLILAASTTLVENWGSYCRLRNFAFLLCAVLTLIATCVLYPTPFAFIANDILEIPAELAHLARITGIILLPLPFAVGYRRFYQGILIRHELSSRVAAGTAIRLVIMSSVALILLFWSVLPGAYVGAISLTLGILAEAIISRILAVGVLKRLKASAQTEQGHTTGYTEIFRFYLPLALTGIVNMSAHPLLTFFLAHAAHPIESLAVFPVLNNLLFLLSSLALAFQEVVLAQLGRRPQSYAALRTFRHLLTFFLLGVMSILAFSPLSYIWFHSISGLNHTLTSYALTPTRIAVALPVLSLALVWLRALHMHAKRTHPITISSLVELLSIATVMAFLVSTGKLSGVEAAACSLVLGRFCACVSLIGSYQAIRPKHQNS